MDMPKPRIIAGDGRFYCGLSIKQDETVRGKITVVNESGLYAHGTTPAKAYDQWDHYMMRTGQGQYDMRARHGLA
jgi:hypothetical protein